VQKGWSGCYASFVLCLSRISLSDYALRRLPSAACAELSCSFTVYLLDIAGCCRTLYLGAYGVTVMQTAVFPELASLLVWHLQYLPFLYAHAAMHYPWGVLLFVVGVDCACWSMHYCFMHVLIMLVGQLYQDHGVSGVQGWAVGFWEHVTSVDTKIGSWNSGFISSLAQPWSCRGFQMSFVISSPPPLSQRYAAVLVFFDIDFIMLLVSKFLQYL